MLTRQNVLFSKIILNIFAMSRGIGRQKYAGLYKKGNRISHWSPAKMCRGQQTR